MNLSSLHPEFKPIAAELVRRCEVLFPVRVISARRTQDEQDHLVQIKLSRRRDSLHLHGLAVDIAPVHLLKMKHWAPEHADWLRMGLIGESLGLRWGGRWQSFVDRPHFECSREMEHAILQPTAKRLA